MIAHMNKTNIMIVHMNKNMWKNMNCHYHISHTNLWYHAEEAPGHRRAHIQFSIAMSSLPPMDDCQTRKKAYKIY